MEELTITGEPREIFCLYSMLEGGSTTITAIEEATRNNDFLPGNTIDLDLDCLYSEVIEKMIENDKVIQELLIQKHPTTTEDQQRSRNIRIRRTAIVLAIIALSEVGNHENCVS